jgi:hypothetical protein
VETSLDVRFLEPTRGQLVLPFTFPEGLCDYQLFPADRQGPAEYCENERDPDSDFCSDHNPDRCEPDWDSIGKDLRHGFDD